MSEPDKETGVGERLVEAYNRMLERIRGAAERTGRDALPGIQQRLDQAMEKATELGELSREEAERIADYLRRDLEDAARFVGRSGRELADWLRFDLDAVEKGIAEAFTQAVDQSRVELGQFTEQADQMGRQMGRWRTGEVTGIGTLQCSGCGELLHFHRTGHIPPCPKCRGTAFRRVSPTD